MARQVGGAIGIAILVTVAASVGHHSRLGSAAGVVHGYRTVFVISAAVSLASVLPQSSSPRSSRP